MDVTSKISMYDFFAILIPGFFILLLVYSCSTKNAYDADVYSILIVAVLSYLVGMVYHKLIECLFEKLGWRNNEDCIKKQLDKLNNKLGKCKLIFDFEGTTGIKVKYYEAYYFLMEKDCLNSIPVLEAQFVFLRNMIPLCVIYGIAICACNTLACNVACFVGLPCCIIAFLFVLAIVLAFIAICIQKKIYYLVWDGFKFLKNQDKKCG